MLVHRPSPTDDRLAEGLEPDAPALSRRPLRERIDLRVAIGLGIGWLVLPEIAAALEPAPQHPDPAWAVALGYGMNVVLFATLVGLAIRHRWGLVTSLVGATVMTAFVVACPTSGHHAWGLWWLGEMACMLTLVAASVWALRLPPVESPQPS